MDLELPRALVYALPLASYTGAIVLLCAHLLPAAWRRHAKNPVREWAVDGKPIMAQLMDRDDATVWLKTDKHIIRPSLTSLPAKDKAQVDAHGHKARYDQQGRLFFVLGLAAFGVTWAYMLQYFTLSFATYTSTHVQRAIAMSPLSALNMLRKPQRLSIMPLMWLRDVSLFDEAWSYVCDEPARWLLSLQLCLFAVVFFAPLILTSTYERKTYALSSLILGQIVAISVATGFVLRLPNRPARTVSLLMWPGLLGATLLTGALPSVIGTRWFLPVLVGLHVLLFAPLLPVYQRPRYAARLEYLYIALSFIALSLHLGAIWAFQSNHRHLSYVQLLSGEIQISFSAESIKQAVKAVAGAFRAHPAQASIGSDAIFCAVIYLLFVASDRHCPGWPEWIIALIVAIPMPIAGLGFSGALYMARREKEILEEQAMLGES